MPPKALSELADAVIDTAVSIFAVDRRKLAIFCCNVFFRRGLVVKSLKPFDRHRSLVAGSESAVRAQMGIGPTLLVISQ